MPDIVVSKVVSVDQSIYQTKQVIDSNAGIPFDRTIPAAKTGTLTTRTNNTDGTLTMTAGHGFTTGIKIDVYWFDPTTGLLMSRHQVVTGTVATNSVPISGGSGDNLPLLNAAITAAIPVSQSVVVTGDNVVGVLVKCQAGGTFGFAPASNTVAYSVSVRPDSGRSAGSWTSIDGSTNPVAGQAITQVFLSHPDATKAILMSGEVLYN